MSINHEDFFDWAGYSEIKHEITYIDYKEIRYGFKQKGWTDEIQKEAIDFMQSHGIKDPESYLQSEYHKECAKILSMDYYRDKKDELLTATKLLNAFVSVLNGGQTYWLDFEGNAHGADMGYVYEFLDDLQDYLEEKGD